MPEELTSRKFLGVNNQSFENANLQPDKNQKILLLMIQICSPPPTCRAVALERSRTCLGGLSRRRPSAKAEALERRRKNPISASCSAVPRHRLTERRRELSRRAAPLKSKFLSVIEGLDVVEGAVKLIRMEAL